jgi:hypothetical protein
MKPSHVIIIFLLGGIVCSFLSGNAGLAILLFLFLVLAVFVAILGSMFRRPGTVDRRAPGKNENAN